MWRVKGTDAAHGKASPAYRASTPPPPSPPTPSPGNGVKRSACRVLVNASGCATACFIPASAVGGLVRLEAAEQIF